MGIEILTLLRDIYSTYKKIVFYKKNLSDLIFPSNFLKACRKFCKMYSDTDRNGKLGKFGRFFEIFFEISKLFDSIVDQNFLFSEFSLDILNYKFYSSFQKFIISIKD